MLKEDMRRVLSARFYQSLAESGVEVTAIPQQQLQAIVSALSDGIIEVIDKLDDNDSEVIPAAVNATDEEKLLWTGKPYLSIGVRYELTSQRLRISRGLLGRSVEEIELVRVRDTSITQQLGERALNVGDIEVFSNDPSDPTIKLHNVKQANEVRELIRKAVMAERKRRGFAYREEM